MGKKYANKNDETLGNRSVNNREESTLGNRSSNRNEIVMGKGFANRTGRRMNDLFFSSATGKKDMPEAKCMPLNEDLYSEILGKSTTDKDIRFYGFVSGVIAGVGLVYVVKGVCPPCMFTSGMIGGIAGIYAATRWMPKMSAAIEKKVSRPAKEDFIVAALSKRIPKKGQQQKDLEPDKQSMDSMKVALAKMSDEQIDVAYQFALLIDKYGSVDKVPKTEMVQFATKPELLRGVLGKIYV